jgi:TM2 domain-containing membrane protein YozV
MKRLIFSLFISTAVSFATVTVDGYAYLGKQNDHSGINIIFDPRDTGPVTNIATTDANGYFTVQVETKNYFITYAKDGYFSEPIKPYGAIDFDTDTTLSSVTLIKQTKLIEFVNFIENIVVDNYRKLDIPQKLLERIQLADTTSQTTPTRHHQPDISQTSGSEPAIRFSKNVVPSGTPEKAEASDQPVISQSSASEPAIRFSKIATPPEASGEAEASDQPPASNLATRFSKNTVMPETTGEAGASDQPVISQSLASEPAMRFSKNVVPSGTPEKAEASDQPVISHLATRFSKSAALSGTPGKTGASDQPAITTRHRSARKLPAKTKMGAMVRSLLFPGLGQFYANQRIWGYGWIAAEVVAGGLIVMNYSNYKTANEDYNYYQTSYSNATDPALIAQYKAQSQTSHENIESAMDDMKTMASIAGAVWIANVVHAYMVGPKSEVTAYNEIPLQMAYDQNTDQFKLSISISLD